ncbi:MAG: glutamyl-tRNA reductase [bacterium]|nr:glutamyl-tRNA reductase [bacterium]
MEMNLSVCGFNHKTATLNDREPFQLARSELQTATEQYQRLTGSLEALVLATCNRVEFYQVAKSKSDEINNVISFYRARGIDANKLRDICYVHHKTTTARHIFRVASALDSMVLGEDQVFHQVKEAYSAACAAGGAGKMLHKLFHLAFQVGKRVRSETEIGSGPRGIPGAALDMFKSRLEGCLPKAVLVCGVNETTEIIMAGLSRWGVPTYLTNRTFERSEKLAAAFQAKAVPLDKIHTIIPEVEALFSATSATEPVINPQTFAGFSPGDRPCYIFDLAIPRDVDPSVEEIPGLVLLDLEDIQKYLEISDQQRSKDIPRAEAIIEEQVKVYSQWRKLDQQQEKLLALHKELNRMRKQELERFKEGFHLSEYRALEAFSQSLVKSFMKLLPQAMDGEDPGPDSLKGEN